MMWDMLNKLAIIVTILGAPATLFNFYLLLYKTIVVYDMYKEPNEAGGDTLEIGYFTRSDVRNGKKLNSKRKYHRKGTSDVPENWI